ncbi:hypothetical protein C0580_01280 [Candidatus Parcubacteria bacterium]|nr:MAG: hypothetical protein C0580_01280 [Candidatus Parcubacteria bacterium]
MIFLGNNNSVKTFLLFALVFLIGGLIFLKWFDFGPVGENKNSADTSWQSIGDRVNQAWLNIKSELELNKYESQQTWEEFQRQNKEDQFIKDVKLYLENYSTSTNSTSTEESQENSEDEDSIDNR